MLCFAGALQEKHRSVIAKKNVVAGGTTENIGRESVPASEANMAAGYMYCYKLEETPSSNGTAQSITFTSLLSEAGSGQIYLSIYTHDSGNDLPATVLANSASDEITVTATSDTDYTHTYTGTKPVIASGTQYWLCVSNEGDTQQNVKYNYADTGSTEVAYKSIPHGTFPDWAGSAGGTSDSRYWGKLYFVNGY